VPGTHITDDAQWACINQKPVDAPPFTVTLKP